MVSASSGSTLPPSISAKDRRSGGPMIQVSSAAGGGLRPNASSAKRNEPTMPPAGSVSVPSKSTSRTLRSLRVLIARCSKGPPAFVERMATPRSSARGREEHSSPPPRRRSTLRDSLAADRLVRERRAQEIEKPSQRGENEEAFKGAGDGLAELEEAADRPACGRSGAHELRAH